MKKVKVFLVLAATALLVACGGPNSADLEKAKLDSIAKADSIAKVDSIATAEAVQDSLDKVAADTVKVSETKK